MKAFTKRALLLTLLVLCLFGITILGASAAATIANGGVTEKVDGTTYVASFDFEEGGTTTTYWYTELDKAVADALANNVAVVTVHADTSLAAGITMDGASLTLQGPAGGTVPTVTYAASGAMFTITKDANVTLKNVNVSLSSANMFQLAQAAIGTSAITFDNADVAATKTLFTGYRETAGELTITVNGGADLNDPSKITLPVNVKMFDTNSGSTSATLDVVFDFDNVAITGELIRSRAINMVMTMDNCSVSVEGTTSTQGLFALFTSNGYSFGATFTNCDFALGSNYFSRKTDGYVATGGDTVLNFTFVDCDIANDGTRFLFNCQSNVMNFSITGGTLTSASAGKSNVVFGPGSVAVTGLNITMNNVDASNTKALGLLTSAGDAIPFTANLTGVKAPAGFFINAAAEYTYNTTDCTIPVAGSFTCTEITGAEVELYPALAEGMGAMIGSGADGKLYDTFASALAAAKTGDTIYLLADFTISAATDITKGITIEGTLINGVYPTMHWTGGHAFKLKEGCTYFTMKNVIINKEKAGDLRLMDRPYQDVDAAKRGDVAFYNVKFNLGDCNYLFNTNTYTANSWTFENCSFYATGYTDSKKLHQPMLVLNNADISSVTVKGCSFDGDIWFQNGTKAFGTYLFENCTITNNAGNTFIQAQAGATYESLAFKNITISNCSFAGHGESGDNGDYFLTLYGTSVNVTLENVTWAESNTGMIIGCLNNDNVSNVTMIDVNATFKGNLINLKNKHVLNLTVIGGSYTATGNATSWIYTNDNNTYAPILNLTVNKDSTKTTTFTVNGRTKAHDYNAWINLNCGTAAIEMYNVNFVDETGLESAFIYNRNYKSEGPAAGSITATFVDCTLNTSCALVTVVTGTKATALENVVLPDNNKGWAYGAIARIGNAYYSDAAAAAEDAGSLIAHTFFLNDVERTIYLEAQTELNALALAEGAVAYFDNEGARYFYSRVDLAALAIPAGGTIVMIADRAMSVTAWIDKEVTIIAADGLVVTISNGTAIPFVFKNNANVTFKNLKFDLKNRLARIDGVVAAVNFVNCDINYYGDYFLYSNDSNTDPVPEEGAALPSKTMTVVFDEDTVVTGTAGMGIWIQTAQITKNSRFIFKGTFTTTYEADGALLFINNAAAATMEIYPTAVLSGSISNPNGVTIYRVGGAVNDDNAKEYGVPLKATDATGVYYTNDYFFAFENLIDGEKIYEVPLTAEHSDKTFNINNTNYTVNTANVVDFLFTMFPNLVRINEETYYANLAEAIAAYQQGDVIYILKDMVVIDTAMIDGKTVVIAGLNLGTTEAPVYPTITAGVNVFGFANAGSLTLKDININMAGGRFITVTEAGAAGNLLFDNVYFTWTGTTTSADRLYMIAFNGGFATSVVLQNCVTEFPTSEKGILLFFAASAEGGYFEVKNSVINGGFMHAQSNAVLSVLLQNVTAEYANTQFFNLYSVKQIDITIEDCNLNLLNNDAAIPGAALVYSGDSSTNLLVNVTVKNSYVASNSMNANAPYGAMFSINSAAGCQFNLVFEDSTLFQNHTNSYIVYAKNDQYSCATVRIDVTNCVLKSNAGIFVLKGTKNNADEIDNVVNFNEGTVIYASLVNNGVVVNTGGNSRITFNAPVTDGAKAPIVYAYGQPATISNINDGYLYWADGTSVLTIYDGEFVSTNGSDYLFAATGESSLIVYKGYFEHNGYSCARAYGTTASITIYGGTWILQSTHIGRASSAGMSVIEAGASSRTASLYIYGGIFVNNNDAELAITGAATSRQVIYKSTAGSTVVIEGGVFLATSVQDYFYYNVGNSGAGISIPVSSMPILKGSSPVYNFAGRDCYLYSYNMGTPVAPELDASVTVRLYTDGDGVSSNGLRFTSSINDVIYGALISWVQNLAVEAGLEPNDFVLSFGTLIAPLDTLVEAGAFSVEAFEAAGIDADQYVNIPATEKGLTIDENGLEIRAALVNIDSENYDKLLTARPYVTVTLIDGGAEAADGTEPVSVTSYYGTFNTNKGASSISRAAQRELSDLMAIRTGAYQYKSITVAGGFSRYSKAQQEALLSFVAHKHNFNFKGECIDEGCDYTGATVLDVDDSTKIYCEYGGVSYVTVNLEAGITYNFAFSRKIVRYALYDANGNDCTVVDDKFACTTAGVYHLVITSTGIGSTDLALNHVHEADHTGYCSICEENLSVEINVEENFQQLVTDGMTYYYAIELTGGVSYTVLTKNGYYTLYNANGDVCTIKNGITFECPADGTYYIVVVATFSATGGLTVTHNHDYDYQGYCKIDYCDDFIGKDIVLYQQIGGLVREGDEFRLAIELEANETYRIAFTKFMGIAAIYDAEGNVMSMNNDGSFTCTTAGTYYLAVSVQTDTTAHVYLEIIHDCEYTFKGVCSVCGNDVCKSVVEPWSETVIYTAGSTAFYKFSAYKDTQYQITYPTAGITLKVYTDAGEVTNTDPTADVYFDPTTGIYYNKNSDATVYVVAIATEEGTGTAAVAHIHELDFKGDCTVTNCNHTAATAIKSFGNPVKATWENGKTYYYSFFMTAGKYYNVMLDQIAGDWVIKNAEEQVIFDDEAKCFTVTADITCYLIVTATADAEGSIKVTEAATHALDFKGACTVEGCEYDECEAIGALTEDVTAVDVEAAAGATLYASVVLAEGNTYTFVPSDITKALVMVYDAEGNMLPADANGAYTGANATFYLQILAFDNFEGTITITRAAVPAPEPAPEPAPAPAA